MARHWDQRYERSDCLFGTEPSALLVSLQSNLYPGMRALAVGDGEGRNGIWLASRGLEVLSVDISALALRRAEASAIRKGAQLSTLCTDLLEWEWPRGVYDLVISIFVHFPPARRRAMHRAMCDALAPGGLLLLEAFHVDQAKLASGGPNTPELLYTLDILRNELSDLEILRLDRAPTDITEDGELHGVGVAVQFLGRKNEGRTGT